MLQTITTPHNAPKGLCQLTDYAIITVQGDNAQTFLQGQLSCDVTKLTEHQAMLGSYCNPKGRMLAIFYLLKQQQDYLIVLPGDISQPVISQLKKIALFSRVTVSESQQLVFAQLGNDTKDGYLSPHGFSLFISDNKPKDTLLPTSAWHQTLISQRIPQVFADTIEVFTPHDVGLPELNAVSFDKGCFCGQEIIARMQYLGKLKQHCRLFSLDDDSRPRPGTTIVSQDNPTKSVGQVVSSVQTPQQTLLLAVVKDAAMDNQLTLAT